MEYVVIFWLLCGMVASMIGARKGEGCSGFVIGVLLGPFRILIAIFIKGNRKTCPFCNTVGESNWALAFERTKIDDLWAYKPLLPAGP